MNASTRRARALGLGLAGSSLLAVPALAMNELPGGYALSDGTPPTNPSSPQTPPPTEQARHAEGKCGADGHPTDASSGTGHKHDEGKCGAASGQPAPAQPELGPTASGQAEKGMEGKCGEGKCGGSP